MIFLDFTGLFLYTNCIKSCLLYTSGESTAAETTAAETAAPTTAAETTAAPTTAAPSAGSNYGPGYTPETTAAHAETNQAPSDMGLIAPNGQ